MIRCPSCEAANKGREICGACGAPLTAQPDARGQIEVTSEVIDLATQSSLRLWGWMPLARFASAFRDSRADVARLEAENASLRAALATAKRDGWIAAQHHLGSLKYSGKGHEDESSLIGMFARGVRFAVRALAPPATEGERDG